ncbi:MAG TPA: phospholipase D-like domain-containing protein [Gemmatimonadaceae bacterium]|nr:phospholipase D-like domain-containing protein [Gemmatimonadaceae bacterium]
MRSETARRHHWQAAGSHVGDEQQSAGDRVEWLIDNERALDSLLCAVRDARESIWISQLAFDSDCRAFNSSDPATPTDGGSLIDAIITASAQRRVGVKILLNSSVLLNTRRPLMRFLEGRVDEPRLVEVRGISRFPRLLHAKIVVIDQQRAFLLGSPFVNGYWDTASHAPLDERRPHRELGGRPVHDVSLALQGQVVGEIAATFVSLWNGAEHRDNREDLPTTQPPSRRSSAARSIEVVTTEPRSSRKKLQPGSVGTLNALLDAIRNARSLIYIEHQYLSSRPIVAALREVLEIQPALEIILVLNQNPDVTAYRVWQNERLAESGLLGHPRVGAFALWTSQKTAGPSTRISQVFVHSKVVTIDDVWALVGSANLDGASLDSYGDDFKGRLARRVFRDVRNFDVSVVVRATTAAPANDPVAQLRERLWSEHLRLDPSAISRAQTGKTVSLWNTIAARNAANLVDRGSGATDGSFILPYSTMATPRAQLTDVGVVDAESLDLAFDPGWLEVRLSPNWIRNMFL